MRTWRISTYDQRCRGCDRAIPALEKYLEIQLATSTTRRCRRCAVERFGDTEPDVVIEDAQSETSVPAGVRHQASLGLESGS